MLELRDLLRPFVPVNRHTLVREPAVVRLAAGIDMRGPDDCWPWMAYVLPNGYGAIGVRWGKQYVHRLTHEHLVGPIAPNNDVDHVCHNLAVAQGRCIGRCFHRRCCNPSHLAAVSHRENCLGGLSPAAIHARKTHCIHGHEFTPENIYVWTGTPNGRLCKECRRQSHRVARHADLPNVFESCAANE